jgi:hypothetical protein
MLDASTIFYLAIFTLGSALLIGGWQYRRVKKSEENNEHSAFARHKH